MESSYSVVVSERAAQMLVSHASFLANVNVEAANRLTSEFVSLLPTVLIMLENRFQRFPVSQNAQDWLGC